MLAKQVPPLERWKPEAEKVDPNQSGIPVPLHVLLGEAVDVARFYDKYHDAAEGRPGLCSVADKKRFLTPHTGADILSLREALQQANTAYLLATAPAAAAAPMERARFVVDEISATLEWLFDDGVENERDAQLANVKQAHDDTPDSHDAWAAELDDWAALASMYRKEMEGVGGFDSALIDEAKLLASQMRDRPAAVLVPENVGQAKTLRDQLAKLLHSRMQLVRSATRFVFRSHPEIIREATSAYERRRRANARRGGPKK